MRDIGKNIRTARTRRGLTQDELAERLHVSRQTVSNYETGRSRPDVDMLLAAAEALEVDVQVLLYGEPAPPERREYRLLAAEGAALVVLWAGLFCLGRWSSRFLGRFFMIGAQNLMRIIPVPLFWLLLGWTLVHACGVFLGAKPLERRWARPLRRAVLVCLAVWTVLQAPLAADALCQIAYVLRTGSGSGYGGGPQLPRLWERLSFWGFYYIGVRFPAAFALLGGALWSTRQQPERP